MERERENIWRWCSASTGAWPTGCVTHKSLDHKKHTKFWIVLVILLFYCPFFLKRNVLFENFFVQNNWKHCFSFTQLDIRKEHEKYKVFIPRRTTFFLMRRRFALRDWKLSWSMPRAVSLLSELSPRTISCHWSRPRDIRYIKRNAQENKLNRKKRGKRGNTEQSFSTRFSRNIFIFSEKKKEDDL